MNRRQILHQEFPILPYAISYYLTEEIAGFDSFHERIVEDLSQVFYDYIPLAAFGEVRHARRRCGVYLSSLRIGRGRAAAIESCVKYDPGDFMPLLSEISRRSWEKGYGGPKWARIVESWLHRDDLRRDLWVHQVLSLAHNEGAIFDKSKLLDFGYAEKWQFQFWMDVRSTAGATEATRKYFRDYSVTPKILKTWPNSLGKELKFGVKELYPVIYCPLRWMRKPWDLEIIR